MIFGDNVLCTRGRDPSRVSGGVSEVVPVLSAPQTLRATAEVEAMALVAQQSAVVDWMAAVVGRQAAKADQPAQIPLVVATPEAPAAQAGTPEAKPARVPVAQVATV
jgi:hypothetical protein